MEDPLAGVLGRLDEQIKSGQRKRALRTVEEALKLSSKDQDALAAKVYLLIDLDRIQEALVAIEKATWTYAFDYEKAYCLYRTGELQKALAVVLASQSDGKKEANLQLRAQLHYRLGDYGAAIKAYHEVFNQHKVTSLNVRSNIVAAYTAGGRSEEVKAVTAAMKITAEDGFEVAFNLACSTLHCGDFARAQEMLLLATRLGREGLLEDDYTEEQVDQELAPLAVQLAYVAAATGQHRSALEQLQEVLKTEVSDEGLHALAANNAHTERLVTSPLDKQRAHVLDAIKQADASFDKSSSGLKLKAGVEQRLSVAQQQSLYTNRVLLQLLAGRRQSAKDLMQQLLRRYPESEGVQLLRGSLAARDGKLKEAEAILAAAAQKGGASLQLRMAQADLALQSSNLEQAARILGEVQPPELRSRPAFLTTQAAVLEAGGGEAEALEVVTALQRAVLGDKARSRAEKATVSRGLLPLLARIQLKVGKVAEAFQTFKQLHEVDPSTASSAAVVGALAAAALHHDPVAAETLERHLEDLPQLLAEEISSLEAAGTRRMAKGGAASKADGAGATANKRKRKRQIRLPKGFDPENPGPPPDPERWLPKWQRSDFKRKRKGRKDKDKNKTSHQGGAVDMSLDRTNTETPAAGPSSAQGPRRTRGRGKARR